MVPLGGSLPPLWGTARELARGLAPAIVCVCRVSLQMSTRPQLEHGRAVGTSSSHMHTKPSWPLGLYMSSGRVASSASGLLIKNGVCVSMGLAFILCSVEIDFIVKIVWCTFRVFTLRSELFWECVHSCTGMSFRLMA